MKDINLDDINGVELPASVFIGKCENAWYYIYSQNDYGRVVRDPRGYPNIAKLKDEILPISQYLKFLKQVGNNLDNLKIIWKKGSQKGDAQIFDEQEWILLEVTTARHPNEYLVRHRINQSGDSFTADGLIKRKSGIESKPVALDYSENIKRYKYWIYDRILKKSTDYRGYNIRLIVHVIQDGLILDEEIDEIEQLFKSCILPKNIYHAFISFGGGKKYILLENI